MALGHRHLVGRRQWRDSSRDSAGRLLRLQDIAELRLRRETDSGVPIVGTA
jgi:hypothetical protein